MLAVRFPLTGFYPGLPGFPLKPKIKKKRSRWHVQGLPVNISLVFHLLRGRAVGYTRVGILSRTKSPPLDIGYSRSISASARALYSSRDCVWQICAHRQECGCRKRLVEGSVARTAAHAMVRCEFFGISQ